MTIKATVRSAIEKIESNKTRTGYTMMYDASYVKDYIEGDLTLAQIHRAMYALKRDGFLVSSNMPGVYILKERTVFVVAKIGTHGTGKCEVKPPENIIEGSVVMFRMVGDSLWNKGVINRINDDGVCFIEYA